MKTPLLALFILLTTLQLSPAGGNTSIVDLDKVTSIKIESERIVIVGSGMLRKRVMSDAEHGDDTAFGQPAQWLHAKVTDCEFEIIPYHSRSDVKGVPGIDPDNITPEMKAQSMRWWEGTLAKARGIKTGDAITIGYQREKMTITGFYVTHILGSGSLSHRAVEKDTKAEKALESSTAGK
ncbi:MAG: hypothetical protein AAF514_15355 [Verrucomicrobiota bacterium]